MRKWGKFDGKVHFKIPNDCKIQCYIRSQLHLIRAQILLEILREINDNRSLSYYFLALNKQVSETILRWPFPSVELFIFMKNHEYKEHNRWKQPRECVSRY